MQCQIDQVAGNVTLVLLTGETLVNIVDNVVISQKIVNAVTRHQQVIVVVWSFNTRHIRVRADQLAQGILIKFK